MVLLFDVTRSLWLYNNQLSGTIPQLPPGLNAVLCGNAGLMDADSNAIPACTNSPSNSPTPTLSLTHSVTHSVSHSVSQSPSRSTTPSRSGSASVTILRSLSTTPTTSSRPHPGPTPGAESATQTASCSPSAVAAASGLSKRTTVAISSSIGAVVFIAFVCCVWKRQIIRRKCSNLKDKQVDKKKLLSSTSTLQTYSTMTIQVMLVHVTMKYVKIRTCECCDVRCRRQLSR